MVAIKGGDKLEAALKALSTKVTKPATLSVGFLEGATYPDGTSVPMVAAIQEFGAPARKIPPRPFFRQTIADKSPTWGDAVAKLLVANGYDATRTMGQVGEGIKGQLQDTIAKFNSVPLSAQTIAAKGNAKQLIDTGVLINSVDWKVD